MNNINWELAMKYFNTGCYIARRIGGRNIIFFGLLGTAITAEYFPYYLVTSSQIDPRLITDGTFSKESNPLKPSMSIHTDSLYSIKT
ncbi:MAG: hypothetical protein KDD45_13215 [Bdellovibrionales bacterium]|nr:hypothetical protein [Bdellovibrionales bacterium]